MMLGTLLCVCVSVGACLAGRVLVVFPVPDRAHSALGDALVNTLLGSHHEVTYVSVYPKRVSNPNLTYVDISSVLTAYNDKSRRSANDILRAGPRIAHEALQHEAMKELLYDPSITFDAVIAEWYYSGLLAPLAALFECPLIWYSAGGVSWQTLRLVHEEPSPAYSVDQLAGAMPALPFTTRERLYNLGIYNLYFVESPAYDTIYRTPLQLRKRFLPAIDTLVNNGSLLLVNSYPPLSQTLPLPQNVKLVGGHHIRLPIKPLPETLQTYLDNAKNGVIFMNLGDDVQRRMPKKQQEQILEVFSNLNQLVLWQMEPLVEYVPRNVRLQTKLPRLGILSHPNTKIFVSDGSLSSLMEATHCGVPVVAVPTGDQFVDVDLVVSRGLGRRVDFTKYLPWHLEGAIGQILRNQSYETNARQASTIFQQRITPPDSELLYWIDEVISTRGAAHLRSPATQVPITERYHGDLWLLVVLGLWFLSKVVKVAQVHLKEDLDKKKQ